MKLPAIHTLGEEIFSAITHGVGAILSIIGLILLIIKADTTLELFAVIVFGSCAIILYTMSTLFHSFPKGTTRNVFQRFDHISIYLLIAGTYTPFSLFLFTNKTVALFLVIFQWTLSIIGIVFKSIWIKKFSLIHVSIFLLMGWSVVFFLKDIDKTLNSNVLLFLLLGGISYSIGVFFYIFRLFKFHHAIWHFFVMFGTILHFISLFFFVL